LIRSVRDLVVGGAALALAIGYYALAGQIPESQLSDAVGPQGLPRIYAYLLGGLSLVLIARSLGPSNDESSGVHRARPAAPNVRRPAGMVVIGVVYLLAVSWLGYFVSLAGLVATTTWYLGGGLNRRVAVVAVSGALLFWLLFVRLLGVQHPAGFWSSLF
jgi:putative tricarboxylic transport membrane protein